MGTGVSFSRHDDDDDVLGVEYNSNSHGVIKKIPIEVKPRGRLGLRSVGSLGRSKQPKGGSLRSALSVDLESPEVEKIRREFDMYKLDKENEMTSLQKKEQKFETENKRLRAELLALQKTTKKLREERDAALEAEHQALVRAAAFEHDRDKVQRQFKIFRETKESELQNLLRARRDLEGKLAKVSPGLYVEDLENASRSMDASLGGGNPGDWWTALESEPSLGSTMQLHQPSFKGPEFAHSMIELDGPFTNVNKEDWTLAAASLAQVLPNVPDALVSNTIKIYISAPYDMQEEVDIFWQTSKSRLEELCCREGRFLTLLHMPCDNDDNYTTQEVELQFQARCYQIEQATIFLAFLSEHTNRFTRTEYNVAHLNNPGAKPAVFCFKSAQGTRSSSSESSKLRLRIQESSNMKMIDNYSSGSQGAELAYLEVDRLIKLELGIREKKETDSVYELEGPEILCGGALWDPLHDCDQMEALAFAVRSTCELGFEKLYERLNARVVAAGPLPPLLIMGSSGSGRSLLLAKWIELQQQRSTASVVLYHFCGTQASCSADPMLMIRRLTAQLMQHVANPPALTCDPVRLVEEFPRWLEKVSSKTPGGVLLVLDSIDRFQQGEAQLKWLLDPLPVDSRVIVSVHQDVCPQSWRSWPTLHMEALSNKTVKELLRAELKSQNCVISNEQESRIVTHCRTPGTTTPLYMVVLASTIAGCGGEEQVDRLLESLLDTTDCADLYRAVLDNARHMHETAETKGFLRKILRLIYASRNGIAESELFEVMPGLQWNFWAPLYQTLSDRHVLTVRSGLLIFAHEQMREAVGKKYFSDMESKTVECSRKTLRDYFSQFLTPDKVTYRVADELPWLNKQLGDKGLLKDNILNLCIFVKLYGRGRCAELISYWHFIGADKNKMAQSYFTATKQMEEKKGHFNGPGTLPRVADMYEALGRFLRDLGLLAEALTPLQRALEIRETALDPDHPSVAQSLHQVAGLHAQWGKFQTAEALYKQALEIYEGAFGSDHYLVAKELDALAVLYQKQDKHEVSEPLHRKAVTIRKKSKGPRVQSGQMRGVDPLRRRTLQLEELAVGPDSPDVARTLNELGVLYYLQNNIEAAESFFQRCLEMRESVLGPDHPDVAQVLYNLAGIYNDRKQFEKAAPLYERALHIRQKHHPSDHQSVASIVKHLAVLYKKMAKLDQAEPLYRQIVEIRELAFGTSHPSVATALVNLAVLYSQQGNHTAALPLYERALKIYEESLGASHPRVAETLRNLALLRYEQGDFEIAAQLYKRATEIKDSDPTYPSKVPSRRSSSADTSSTLKNALNAQQVSYSSQDS